MTDIDANAHDRRAAKKAAYSDAVRKTAFVPKFEVFAILQASGIAAAIWALIADVSPWWWLFGAVMYFCYSCLGMAIGVHRALTHKAFKLARPVEILFSVFGALGGTGSPLGWIANHRTHHAEADTEGDPHSPEHMGWSLLWKGARTDMQWWRVRDILRDPVQRFLHRYYTLVLGAWGLFLLAIDPWALAFGLLIPASLQITVTNLSSILGHGHGYRNYETKDESTNNWLIAILAWGEGWHNNHHARPSHWTLRRKIWEFDPSAWVIRLLVATGGIDRTSFATDNPFESH